MLSNITLDEKLKTIINAKASAKASKPRKSDLVKSAKRSFDKAVTENIAASKRYWEKLLNYVNCIKEQQHTVGTVALQKIADENGVVPNDLAKTLKIASLFDSAKKANIKIVTLSQFIALLYLATFVKIEKDCNIDTRDAFMGLDAFNKGGELKAIFEALKESLNPTK